MWSRTRPRRNDGQLATIVLTPESLPQLPPLLHEFCRRNGVCLVYHCHQAGDQVFMLSWLNEQQRPEFVSLRVTHAAAKHARSRAWWQRKWDAFRRWRDPSGCSSPVWAPTAAAEPT